MILAAVALLAASADLGPVDAFVRAEIEKQKGAILDHLGLSTAGA